MAAFSPSQYSVRKIITLGLPILVGQLGMIATGFADTLMVGHYTTASLASASFVNNLFNVPALSVMGFAFGLTPLAGALFARGEQRRVGQMLRAALMLNLLFALGMTVLMTVVYFNLHRLGQPEELLPLIRPYFLLQLAGLPTAALFGVFSQWSYSIRNTRMPMWVTLTGNVVNVIGNWLLIYGIGIFPELGLTGAGIATLIARIVCAGGLILVFATGRKYAGYREGFKESRASRDDIRQLNRTSWPVSLQMAFETGSFSGSAVMAGWIGAVSLAAFQIIVTVGTLGFCVYISAAAAVSVLVSNAAGENRPDMMRAVAWRGYRVILVMAAAASLFFWLGSRHVMELFSEDRAVVDLATSLIPPLILYQLADATQICFANALRGTSRVMPMLWIALVSYIIIGLPATWFMAFGLDMGTSGIIYSFTVCLMVAAVLYVHYFRRAVNRLTPGAGV